MKNIFLTILIVVTTTTFCACTSTPDSGSSENSQTTGSQTQAQTQAQTTESQTQAQTTESQTTEAQTTESQTTESQTQSTEVEDPGPDMITGTLFAVFNSDDIPEMDFGYESGKCTPERVAEALSEWTGLNFSIVSELDHENGVITVTWLANSSLATGVPPENQKEDFHFYDAVTLRFFMLNSLCRTIRENVGEYDVYYNVEGGDLNEMELDLDFNPAIPYNRIEDSRVLG